MRHVIALLIVCAVLSPLSSTNAKHGGTQDNCEPFGIELPELKTGFLPAPAHKEIPVPANPRLTRILIAAAIVSLLVIAGLRETAHEDLR